MNRLIDYMLVENLCTFTVGSVQNLKDILQMPRQRKTGLFLTNVSFTETDANILFSLDGNHIQKLVNAIIDGIIASMDMVPRILYLTSFKPLVLNSYNRSLLRYNREQQLMIQNEQSQQSLNTKNKNMPTLQKRISLINDPSMYLLKKSCV